MPAGSAKIHVARSTVSIAVRSSAFTPRAKACVTLGNALTPNACVTLGTSMKSVSAML